MPMEEYGLTLSPTEFSFIRKITKHKQVNYVSIRFLTPISTMQQWVEMDREPILRKGV